MTLTTNDMKLRRVAGKRIGRAITVLSAPVWIGPAVLAISAAAIAFLPALLADVTAWLLSYTLSRLNEVKWAAFEAYVKRWPTPPQPDPACVLAPEHCYHERASGASTCCWCAGAAVVDRPVAKFKRYEQPWAGESGKVPPPTLNQIYRGDHLDVKKHPL